MLAPIALLIAAPQAALAVEPVPIGRTAWIFSTVGRSEFCPAGNVTADLRSGRYSFTPRAGRRVCNDRALERPVRKGKLSPRNLRMLEAAYRRVFKEGLESIACREHRPRESIIVSNAGTPILLVGNGQLTVSAPNDLSCWSEAAFALHDSLDRVFNAGE
jgi:hypothetical protein